MITAERLEKIRLHFVIATPRTGSTLLSAMFNTHNRLLSPNEEPFAYNLYPKYKDKTEWNYELIDEFCRDFFLFSEGRLKKRFITIEQLKQVLETHKSCLNFENVIKLAYLSFIPEKDKTEITHIIDKQLEFHYFLEKVARFYPKSKFLVLARNPLDNILVRMKRIERENTGAGMNRHIKLYYYLMLSFKWKYEYDSILSKIKSVEQERVFIVKYEELVLNPEQELKKIADFFRFDFHESMLQYHILGKQHLEHITKDNTPADKLFYALHQGITEKIYTHKIDFWKNELSDEEADLIRHICGATAAKMGYEKCNDKGKIKKGIFYYYAYLYFGIRHIFIPYIYHRLPFRLKYIIKKIKYRKTFKQDRYASGDFSESAI